MTGATEILTELERRGVTLRAESDVLHLKPRRALDEELLSRVREAKPAILEVLRSRPVTCAPACYQVEPGIRIHQPHKGCTTIRPEEGSERKVAVTCWHCRGEKRCSCMACWQAVGPGDCVACKGQGQVWRWIQ